MGDGNSFPLVCAAVTGKSIVLCKCSGNVLIGYNIFISAGELRRMAKMAR